MRAQVRRLRGRLDEANALSDDQARRLVAALQDESALQRAEDLLTAGQLLAFTQLPVEQMAQQRLFTSSILPDSGR